MIETYDKVITSIQKVLNLGVNEHRTKNLIKIMYECYKYSSRTSKLRSRYCHSCGKIVYLNENRTSCKHRRLVK